MIVDRPIRFSGTDEERRANRATHVWDADDPDARCWYCDSRPSHAGADYPCGTRVPRERVGH